MKRLLRGWWVLAMLAVVVAVWLALRPAGPLPVSPGQHATAAAALSDPALIKRGAYLATVGDCAACHTARDGQPYAGGRSLATPFGDVPAPNITPDPATGIGQWSFDDFWRALHEGMGRQGELLYPVFSYTSFTNVTRDDALAIFAYLQSLPPVNQPDLPSGLDFLYSVRSSLVAWRALYFKPGVFKPEPAKSVAWNRGAYLVQGWAIAMNAIPSGILLAASGKASTLPAARFRHWTGTHLTSARKPAVASPAGVRRTSSTC